MRSLLSNRKGQGSVAIDSDRTPRPGKPGFTRDEPGAMGLSPTLQTVRCRASCWPCSAPSARLRARCDEYLYAAAVRATSIKALCMTLQYCSLVAQGLLQILRLAFPVKSSLPVPHSEGRSVTIAALSMPLALPKSQESSSSMSPPSASPTDAASQCEVQQSSGGRCSPALILAAGGEPHYEDVCAILGVDVNVSAYSNE